MTVREYLGFAAALKALPKDTRQEQCRDLMDRLTLPTCRHAADCP